MTSPIRVALAVILASAIGVAVTGFAQQRETRPQPQSPSTPAEATKRIVAAADAVLATLADAGPAKIQFPFDGPQKARWSNLPSGIFQREGLRLADMSASQRAAVTTLLAAALSRPGFQKVEAIMQGDEVLRQTQAPNGPRGGVRAGPGRGVGVGQK